MLIFIASELALARKEERKRIMEMIRIKPEQLHEWYLEACQRPESGMDFNPAAQEPYEMLKETQKFLDKYIADKINSKIEKDF